VLFGFFALLSFMPASPAYANDAHRSDNRLQRLLTVLSYRVGTTVAAAPINLTHAEKAV